MTTLGDLFTERVGRELDLRGIVVAVSRIPYGRPSELTPEAVLNEWRGTCSTKHLLLRELSAERWPHRGLELWNRVYRVDRDLALKRWGRSVADLVPAAGLVDVHMFATLRDPHVVVDATFPVDDWDGTSDMTLWCGPGTDSEAGEDPLASKAQLVEMHCDPSVREPFIEALSRAEIGTGLRR